MWHLSVPWWEFLLRAVVVYAFLLITRHELNAALRHSGCASVESVRAALLETNGSVSVIPWNTADPPARERDRPGA
jgi:uncharacterized membrane protein YcaP (DUF421 family)